METSGSKYKIETIIKDKNVCRFSHQAMATVFEIFFLEENEDYAAQAADSAFSELDSSGSFSHFSRLARAAV